MKYCILNNKGHVIDGPKENLRDLRPGERKIKAFIERDHTKDCLLFREYGPVFDSMSNGKAIFKFHYSNISLTESIDKALVLISDMRKSKEEAGITFDDEPFAVNDKNKSRLMGIWISCQIDPDRDIDMKIKNGKHKKVGKSDIDDLSEAVSNHTQNCYSRESVLVSMIDACESPGDVKSVIDEELENGWPE